MFCSSESGLYYGIMSLLVGQFGSWLRLRVAMNWFAINLSPFDGRKPFMGTWIWVGPVEKTWSGKLLVSLVAQHVSSDNLVVYWKERQKDIFGRRIKNNKFQVGWYSLPPSQEPKSRPQRQVPYTLVRSLTGMCHGSHKQNWQVSPDPRFPSSGVWDLSSH